MQSLFSVQLAVMSCCLVHLLRVQDVLKSPGHSSEAVFTATRSGTGSCRGRKQVACPSCPTVPSSFVTSCWKTSAPTLASLRQNPLVMCSSLSSPWLLFLKSLSCGPVELWSSAASCSPTTTPETVPETILEISDFTGLWRTELSCPLTTGLNLLLIKQTLNICLHKTKEKFKKLKL